MPRKDNTKVIVILMSVGSPRGRNEIRKYIEGIRAEHHITKTLICGMLRDPRNIFTVVRALKMPTSGQIESLYAKYLKIGGMSPLVAITQRQANRLRSRLQSSNVDADVEIAMKRLYPSINHAMSRLRRYKDPIIIGIAMFPTYSTVFGDEYERMFIASMRESGIKAHGIVVKSWDDNAKFRNAWINRISDSYSRLNPKKTIVIFATHSIPKVFIDGGDPYIKNFESLARSLATEIGIRNWACAYYTGGYPASVPEVTRYIHKCKEDGYGDVLLVPLGYVADNFETLYGLGLMCKKAAAESGIRLISMHPLNDSLGLSDALHDIVLDIIKNPRRER